jgi:hypothetical protein
MKRKSEDKYEEIPANIKQIKIKANMKEKWKELIKKL